MGFVGHILKKIIAFFVGVGLIFLGASFLTMNWAAAGVISIIVGLLIIGTALKMMWVN